MTTFCSILGGIGKRSVLELTNRRSNVETIARPVLNAPELTWVED